MSKHSRKYSVSGDDLERADSLGLASSYQPVSSYSAPVNNLDSLAAKTEAAQVELETKVIRRFPKISQLRRRPLLGHLIALSLLRQYAKQVLTPQK